MECSDSTVSSPLQTYSHMTSNQGPGFIPPLSAEAAWDEGMLPANTGAIMNTLSSFNVTKTGDEANMTQEISNRAEVTEDSFSLDGIHLDSMPWLSTPMVCLSFINLAYDPETIVHSILGQCILARHFSPSIYERNRHASKPGRGVSMHFSTAARNISSCLNLERSTP